MSLNKFCLGLLLMLAAWMVQAAEPLRISLLLGDISTKQTVDVMRTLQAELPELAAAKIVVYSSTKVLEQDLEHLSRSDLVILTIMGRTQVNSIRDHLAQAIKGGGQVYAFGGTEDEQDKAMGIRTDLELRRYFETGGAENTRNGLLYALSKRGLALPFVPPQAIPEVGLYDAGTKSWYTDFEAFRNNYAHYDPKRPWVGFFIYQANVVAGTTAHIDAVIDALEKRGLNVMTVFSYPPEKAIEQYFLDAGGKSRVEAVVAASIKIGVNPDTLIPLFKRLNVPVINAISVYSQTRAEWEASPIGLDIMERSWQLAMPEMAGLIQPTVFAAKERFKDPDTGVEYMEERAIPERVEMLARRVHRWVELRRMDNHDKRVFLQYFNFPPGKEGVGASFLNVVPESLWQVMTRMKEEGYKLDGMPTEKKPLQDAVLEYGSNIPNWNHDMIEELAKSGHAVLLPVETYKKWFAELPQAAQDFVIKSHGRPEVNTIMAYIDEQGKRYFVLPVIRYGNVLLGPQPSRGWTEDPEHLYHDVTISAPHQYIAFYLWLHKEFKPDAMLQFGTHGTHEWLPGKEAGLSIADSPEYLIQDLPNLYAFIMDDTGEGTIAQRRGMAVMITHMTPPFDKAGLNPELRELEAKIAEYQSALQKSPLLAEAHLDGINELAERMGLFKDLEMGKLEVFHGDTEHPEHEHDHAAHDFSGDPTPELIDTLHHYLEEMSDRPTPFGLHTLGVAPQDKFIDSTAEAIVSLDTTLSAGQRRARVEEIKGLIRLSARQELDSVISGFNGGYIEAGVGGDPLRNPNALPTGRNFYSFDPRRIPAESTYKLGAKLARELIETYKGKHGEYPDKLTFTLWGVETMRHEGVQESQIMYLMGVRPVWDARGVVRGVEPISRAELGRPRIDVTIIPSGMHRDIFSNVMALLDSAVSVAQAQEEPDNALRNNTAKTRAMLEQRGVKAELAARMAAVRMFTVPSGAYGTNLSGVTDRSDTWDDEQKVADVYFMRMSHMYGQGFWGESGEAVGQAGVGKDLLKAALSGTKMTVHSRSSNVYQVLTGDDPFQSFGGVSMAVRAVDGKTPEVFISNLENAANMKQETLDKYMGREMRTRYLNPEWIKEMQKEGYSGAKFMNMVVQNLWGWQVTVPEAVDAAKWNEMYATYVQDRHNLDMEEFFRDSGNLWAYQALMTRMLEAVRKGYWKPDDAVVQDLGQKVSDLIEELQLKCTEEDCHDPILTKLVQANLVPVPAPAAVAIASAMPAAAAAGQASPSQAPSAEGSTQAQPVEGYAMQEVSMNMATEMKPVTPWMQILGFLALCAALGLGFMRVYRWSYRIRA